MNKEDKHSKESAQKVSKSKSEQKADPKKTKKKKEDQLATAVSQWEEKYNELNDKYLRLYSEFDNYRKRTQKEKIEMSKNASEDIILSLLPVIDDLERALGSPVKNEDGQEMIPMEGLQLIYQKFNGLLGQKGLEPIQSKGEEFDVDFHDAITNIPAPEEKMKGKVIDEVEKGYKLNGKVIRYSKVVVGI
jgi:molecular chaperone GrpE